MQNIQTKRKSASSVGVQLADEWRQMPEDKKNVYTDLAKDDRERYEADLNLYYIAQVKAKKEAKEIQRIEKMNTAKKVNPNQKLADPVRLAEDHVKSKYTRARDGTCGHPNQKGSAMSHTVKGQLEFKQIKMCNYFSSRALIDDASIKNYVKSSKSQLVHWLRQPRAAKVESVIRKFCLQMEITGSINGKLHSYNDLDGKVIINADRQMGLTGVLGELLDAEFLKRCLVNFRQKPVLEKVSTTRKTFQFDDDSNEQHVKQNEQDAIAQGKTE